METEVKIFIESSWKGPAVKDGVAMWLVECIKDGEPITRQGFIHVENGTEAQGCLMAIINAFCVIKNIPLKCHSVPVMTGCEHILSVIKNNWHMQWKDNNWHTARGKPVKNSGLWEMFVDKTSNYNYYAQGGKHEYTSIMQDDLKKELERWKHSREEAVKVEERKGTNIESEKID